MPSNREAYFEAIKQGIPKSIINFALQEVNNFSYLDLAEKFDEEIKDYDLFARAISRYQNGEMIEYIFNKSYFLSLPLFVDKSVLIPRQETEELVILSLNYIRAFFNNNILNIADVCTGSGAIGLFVAKSLPYSHCYLSDLEKEAIRVAKINAENLNIPNTHYLCGDMLKPFIQHGIKLDVLICNPPYIENEEPIDKKTWEQEPHIALLAKPCTKYYESIFSNLNKVMNDKFLVCLEIGEDMEEKLTQLIHIYCPNCQFQFEKDMYDRTRFLFIKQI